MASKLVSSCLFLRYLCPAILGPNLFNITDEYPSERSNRNLTLIAKTLQTLANFARYEGKENSMEFMNSFLDEEMGNMKTFLQLVSSPPPEDWIHDLNLGNDKADLGRHLSNLHTILVENISKVPSSDNLNLDHIKAVLNDINANLHRPLTSTLDNIAEPTPVKIKRMSVEDKVPSPPAVSQTNVISNWMSWTLGRGDKKTKVSEPIPQHKFKSGGGGGGGPVKTTFYTPDVTESSSSSASLTPSPKYSANPGLWAHAQSGGIRKNARSVSSISIIDDSDSESSSGCSQYRVEGGGGHPALHFSTLPRPRTETKTLSDYEREIHGLRSAMESLQVKLQDAERRLQSQQCSGSSSGSERSAASPPRHSPTKDDYIPFSRNEEVKELLGRLLKEEDLLRRDQQTLLHSTGDKELMILLQQRKIAALDSANHRLVTELSRLGEKVGYRSKQFQETPRTVDELLDSFNDTPV